MARVYALKTYHDGSTALVKMTRREIEDANECAWRGGSWPSAKEITKREARELYQTAPLDVIESSIVADFDPEEAA